MMAVFAVLVHGDHGWNEVARIDATGYAEAIWKAEPLMPPGQSAQPLGLKLLADDDPLPSEIAALIE